MPVSSDRVGGDGVTATAVSARRNAPRRFGAVSAADGVTFTVWAPEQQSLRLVIEGRGEWDLDRDDEGYFTLDVADARTGDRYWFRMANGTLRPDPATRFQPDGPLNASMVVDSWTYRWRDSEWPGVTAPHRQVLYSSTSARSLRQAPGMPPPPSFPRSPRSALRLWR